MNFTFGEKIYNNIPTFKDVKIGEIFMQYGEVYMKINDSENEDNAIRLIDAHIVFFDCNDEVELCKYELIIHRLM